MKRVVVIGMGGLGCPALLALGNLPIALTIYDGDRVDVSNLHRQILYRTADVGAHKATTAARALAEKFPHLQITAHDARATADAVRGADLVLECSDSLALKFAINDACVAGGVRLLIGGVVDFAGQLMRVGGAGGCYRCLFEELPSEGAITCTEAGVLGPAAGIVGARQGEAARAFLTRGELMGGALTLFDLRSDNERTVTVPRRRDCAAHTQKETGMATIRIPTSLRKFTQGKEEVAIDGKTVGDLLAALESAHPGIKERICDDKGAVRRFVNIFVKDEDIRFKQNLDTPVTDGDEVSIVPAIAGG